MRELRHPALGSGCGDDAEAKAMAENAWGWEKRAEKAAPGALMTEHATIGASVVIQGDVSGNEPLFIDGTVEGSIHFPDHRVTLGRSSRIRADIRAREVVVMGAVDGNIYCSDLLDVRSDGSITGQMIAERIRIDDGATLKGNIEVHSAKRSAETDAVFHEAASRPSHAEMPPADAFKESLLEAAAAVSISGGQPARRVTGSRTLVEPAH
jgi:cytoskeletal protein CcmA (bactofilin family)